MALQYFAQINLTKDYPGFFNSGDQLLFYFDDVTGVIEVKRTTVTATYGTNITTLGNNGTIEQILGVDPVLTPMVVDSNATLSVSTTVARTGTRSMRIAINAGSQRLFNFNMLGTTPLTTTNYLVTCWVRTQSGGYLGQPLDKLYLDITSAVPGIPGIIEGASILERNEVTFLETNNTWKQLRMRVTVPFFQIVPVVFDYLLFTVRHNITTTSGGFLYVDDIEVKEEISFSQVGPSTITSGADLGVLSDSQFLSGLVSNNIFRANNQFCIGTTLNYFNITLLNPSFPYAVTTSETDSPTCGFNGVVCDLSLFVVSANSPTSAYLSDGSFQIGSQSSNGVRKYSLTDQIYSGMSNTTGIFSGLLPGNYTVFSRDASNCRATINVTVPLYRGDGVKYRLEFKDIQNLTTSRIDILEKNFNGTLTEVKGLDMPIKLSLPQITINNKYEAVRPSFAEVSLLSETNYQFLNLFTQTDKQFRVNYYRPVGTLLWSGYLQSSIFSEEFIMPPYGTTVKAIDGLELLKNIKLSDSSGNKLNQSISFIKLIALILGKLDLSLPIRCGVNMNEITYTVALTDDPLVQSFCDAGDLIEDDETAWDCFRVIEFLLKPFGATIIQWGGRWNVVEIDKISQPYKYRDFDANGNYLSNGTFDPVIEIKDPTLRLQQAFADYNHSMEIVPAYKEISVRQKLFPKKSILKGDFKRKDWNGVTWDGWSVDRSNGGLASPLLLTDIYGNNVTGNIEAAGLGGTSYQPNSPPSLGSIVTNTNFVLLTSDVKQIKFTGGDSLKLSFKYLLSLGFGGEPKFVKIQWALLLNTNSTTFYFSERVGWNSNIDYKFNTIYVSKFNSFDPFTKDIQLPDTSGLLLGGEISLVLKVSSGAFWEFKDDASLKAIPTANVLQLETKVRGVGVYPYYNPLGIYWDIFYYTLTSSQDAESSPDTIRPNDYDATTNAVVWKLEDRTGGSTNNGSLKRDAVVLSTGIDDIVLEFLPSGQKAISEVIYSQTINPDYRDSLIVDIEGGDFPFDYDFNYVNYFKKQNGTPTNQWSLFGTAYIQEQLLARLVKQYQSPTLKISGNLLSYGELGFLNVIKHALNVQLITLANPEMNTSGVVVTGWENFGGATPSWVGVTNKASLTFTAGQNSSRYFITSAQTLINAGQRLRIELNIQRTGGSGRQDDFIICFFAGGSLVQVVSANRFETDTTVTKIVKVTIGQNIDRVGFYVLNWGDASAATYLVDYFRLTVLQPIRYYGLNSIIKDDRNNDMQVELMQIIPLDSINDPTTVEDGPPNGDVTVVNGAFSDGFDEGFLI